PKRTCEICGNSFVLLEQHMQIHSSVKPFPCSFCDLSFTAKHSRTNHFQMVHLLGKSSKGRPPAPPPPPPPEPEPAPPPPEPEPAPPAPEPEPAATGKMRKQTANPVERGTHSCSICVVNFKCRFEMMVHEARHLKDPKYRYK